MNKRLGKPWFDCANLDAEYDCGCGDDPKEKQTLGNTANGSDPMDLEHVPSVDRNTGVEMIKGG